jgi:hypothetical protein
MTEQTDPQKLRAALEQKALDSEQRMSSALTSAAFQLVQALANRRVDGINLRIERERLDFVMRTQAVWTPAGAFGYLKYQMDGASFVIQAMTYERAIDRAMRDETDGNRDSSSPSYTCTPQAAREPDARTESGISEA